MTKDEEDAIIRQKKLDAAQDDVGVENAGSGKDGAVNKGQDADQASGTGGSGAAGAGEAQGFGTGTSKP